MDIDFRWRSRAGSRTEDNRDFAGIGICANEALCIVLDGATAGAGSGTLARHIGIGMIDRYVTSKESVDAEQLVVMLRDLHAELKPVCPQASASYMLVLIRQGESTLVLHAGDCLFGHWDRGGQIEWLSRPHTLANAFDDLTVAMITVDSDRYRLTRSFRSREFMLSEILKYDVGCRLLVATDGFWADLSDQEQKRFLDDPDTVRREESDDCSVLQILISGSHCSDVSDQESSDSLYVRRQVADL